MGIDPYPFQRTAQTSLYNFLNRLNGAWNLSVYSLPTLNTELGIIWSVLFAANDIGRDSIL